MAFLLKKVKVLRNIWYIGEYVVILQMFKIIYMFSRFKLYQHKFWRKFFGGRYYYINPKGLPMGPFWSNIEITSCQSVVDKVEYYD